MARSLVSALSAKPAPKPDAIRSGARRWPRRVAKIDGVEGPSSSSPRSCRHAAFCRILESRTRGSRSLKSGPSVSVHLIMRRHWSAYLRSIIFFRIDHPNTPGFLLDLLDSDVDLFLGD